MHVYLCDCHEDDLEAVQKLLLLFLLAEHGWHHLAEACAHKGVHLCVANVWVGFVETRELSNDVNKCHLGYSIANLSHEAGHKQ